MGTSLTETRELNEGYGKAQTALQSLTNLDWQGMSKLVSQKDTTEVLDYDAAVLEAAGTWAGYVAGPIEPRAQLRILKFHSQMEGVPIKKEPGAGLVQERSIILQEWEGVVLEREKQRFTARLYEGFRDFPVKQAEISLEEVADEQRDSVVAGARFSWMIGYRLRSGTRSRFSEIYFRRLPPWSKEELDKAAREVEKLREDAAWH